MTNHAVVLEAAFRGDVDAIELMPFYPQFSDSICCSYAVRGGSIQTLEYVMSRGYKCGIRVTECACAKGHFGMLKWLVDNGYPLTSRCSSIALFNNHTELSGWVVSMIKNRKNTII